MIFEWRRFLSYLYHRVLERPFANGEKDLILKVARYVPAEYKGLYRYFLSLGSEPLNLETIPAYLKPTLNQVDSITPFTENEALAFITNIKLIKAKEYLSKVATNIDLGKMKDAFYEATNLVRNFTNVEEENFFDWKKDYLMDLREVVEKVIFTGTFFDSIGGLKRDDFVIIGAGTGVGKTTWLLTLAKKLMRLGLEVLYVDWEAQSSKSLGRLSESVRLSESDSKLWFENPVFFVSTPISAKVKSTNVMFYLWITKLIDDWKEERARFFMRNKGMVPELKKDYPDVILLDYLQIITSKIDIKDIEEFCRLLYGWASLRGILIITASQLRKDMNSSKGIKIPTIKDLYGLSTYAHTASRVVTITRNQGLTDYIKNKWRKEIPNADNRLGGFLIYIAKNRDTFGDGKLFIVEYDYETMSILEQTCLDVSKDKPEEIIEQYISGSYMPVYVNEPFYSNFTEEDLEKEDSLNAY